MKHAKRGAFWTKHRPKRHQAKRRQLVDDGPEKPLEWFETGSGSRELAGVKQTLHFGN